MPTVQPRVLPPTLSPPSLSLSSLSPSSPPLPHSFVSSASSLSSPYRFSSDTPPIAMERSHQSRWSQDRSVHNNTYVHGHSYNDRVRKDSEAMYYSSHSDPYYQHPHSESRSHSPSSPSHHDRYQRQSSPEAYHHQHYQYQSSHCPPQSHHYQENSGSYRTNGEHYFGRLGHRRSTDSAAADTLLLLSAAAFMDPAAVRAVMATDIDKRMGTAESTDDHHDSSSSNSSNERHVQTTAHHNFHTAHATYSHHQRRFSPPPDRPCLHPMTKTISAPVLSSSSASPLPTLEQQSRLFHRSVDMDMDMVMGPRQPSPSSSVSSNNHPLPITDRSVGPNCGSSTLIPDARTRSLNLVFSVATSEQSVDSVSSNFGDSPATIENDTTEVMQMKKNAQGEDDEGEDEVMSEGVVHLNMRSTPGTLSSQSKTRSSRQSSHPSLPMLPSISTSASVLQANQSSQDSPRTPTSAKTPRTPKQNKAPKLAKAPRMPKRSHSDFQASNSISSGRGGRNSLRDTHGDYFFSPFPPSASTSTATSPSSPSSFQAQLQLLTQNFVSVQPRADTTTRFRRVPTSHNNATVTTTTVSSTATPPFSPPVSPGADLIRDSPFNAASSPATASPTKGVNASGTDGQTTESLSLSLMPSSSSIAPITRSSSSAKPTMTTSQRSLLKPRWHTQPYMMYLALRAMPNQTAARQELIMAAVELDKKFSAEKGLPRVFTGKTPMNSASACLTNNGDKYFIPFKPEGSRSTHFRLAYQPVDFESTLKAYNNWMEQLIKHDWPRCFGNPKEGIKKSQLENESIRTTRPEIQRAYSSPESKKRGPDLEEQEDGLDSGNNKKVRAEGEEDGLTVATALNQEDNRKDSDRMHIHRLDIKAAGSYDGSTSCPPTPTAALAAATEKSLSLKEPFERASPIYRLEDLDLEGVPTDLADIVQVNVSMIPNAGNGLFAKIDVPAGTPLGFYFGVPMTENEFDSLKDGVGQALHYSLMYQRTVLDATDDHGQPYRDPRGRLFCPFHFMNDDSDGNVSFIAGSVVNQVICMTNRDVKAGEELLVYFGKEVIDRGSACLSPSPSSISTTASASTPASASVTAPAPAPALTIPGVATGSQGQEMTVQPDEDLDGKKSTKAAGSRSRASSPLKRIVPAEDTGRPRRESAYKPVRYTR